MPRAAASCRQVAEAAMDDGQPAGIAATSASARAAGLGVAIDAERPGTARPRAAPRHSRRRRRWRRHRAASSRGASASSTSASITGVCGTASRPVIAAPPVRGAAAAWRRARARARRPRRGAPRRRPGSRSGRCCRGRRTVGLAVEPGMGDQIGRQHDPPFGIERQSMCAAEDDRSQVVLLVGEQCKVVEAGAQPVHELFVARLDRRQLRRWIDVDAGEAAFRLVSSRGTASARKPALSGRSCSCAGRPITALRLPRKAPASTASSSGGARWPRVGELHCD